MKVYLDTSVISALFDDSNPERKSLTESFIKQVETFDVYISEITVAEINRTQDSELRNKMRKKVSQFSVLSLTDDVKWLAEQYIRYGAIPESYQEDAYHIAVAVINEMDFLLSWNFKHIVRIKTRDIVRMVNTLNNLRQIVIITPAELL
jgi:predicted nucleic acid-binding protein